MTDNPTKFSTHASESGHWYDQRGNQIETVTGSKGQPVKPDLRHARKLDLARGITSVLACGAKPQLVVWQVKQGILAALTLPRLQSETEDDWIARVVEDAKQTAIKAAEEGTRIHAAIQQYVQKQPAADAYKPHVAGAMEALQSFCGEQNWRAEVACVSKLGYGTKLDLISNQWLIDWKGKDGGEKEFADLKTYDDHAMQLAAGRAAISHETEPHCRGCAIGFVSRTHPGVCRLVEVTEDDLARGWRMFKALLAFSQAKDQFRPSWATEAP